MTTRAHGEEARRRWVQGLREAQARGESMSAYCRRTGVPERTGRSWVRRLAPPPPSPEQVLGVLRHALSTIRTLVAVTEARLGVSPPAGPTADDFIAEAQAEVERQRLRRAETSMMPPAKPERIRPVARPDLAPDTEPLKPEVRGEEAEAVASAAKFSWD